MLSKLQTSQTIQPSMVKVQKKTQVVVAIFALILIASLIYISKTFIFKADVLNDGESKVSVVSTNWKDFESGGSTENLPKIPEYEKYELTFNIDWYKNRQFELPSAKYDPIADKTINPDWPYDASPAANITAHPNAVPAGKGVSVDGLFSNDNWATTITQPAFYYQDYEQAAKPGADNWIYPKGNPVWKIRFAAKNRGDYQYQIRIKDSTGETTYSSPQSIFSVTNAIGRGFVQNSPNDIRYFETSDGKYLNLVGLDTADESKFATYKANGINLVRPWWQGSHGPILFGLTGQGGFLASGWYAERGGAVNGVNYGDPVVETNPANVPKDNLFSFKIQGDGKIGVKANVEPSVNYRVSVVMKTQDLVSENGGFFFFPFPPNDGASNPVYKSEKIKGTNDWSTVSLDFTSQADQYSTDLNIYNEEVTSGVTYISSVSMREVNADNSLGPEIVAHPNIEVQQSVSPSEAYRADYQTELAKKNDIYLKVVLEEKQDGLYSRIQADGTTGTASDDNVYAGDTHASRTYQEYYWRYIIARYSYATSIQSFELLNEGDPFNGNHVNALKAFSDYFNQNDPIKHLTTTSNWHSYPTKEMWQNASNIGYTDLHAYIGKLTGGNLSYQSWINGESCCGYKGTTNFSIDKNNFVSAPSSLYLDNRGTPGDANEPAGADRYVSSYPIPVIEGHSYTLRGKIKGKDLVETGSLAGSPDWIHPHLDVLWKSGHQGDQISGLSSGGRGDFMGTYDWKDYSASGRAPAGTKYAEIRLQTQFAVGELWFDDVTLHDETDNVNVRVPNGDFTVQRIDYDTAALTDVLASQIGSNYSRAITKPGIVGETGVSGDKVFGDIYKGLNFTGENQMLVDDTAGTWYKKFIWGQINPYGATMMYWWDDVITKNNLFKFAKSYQAFMQDIDLSNGKYKTAEATTSNNSIRAWGQKERDSSGNAVKAHLWIDNIPYNWKVVVDNIYNPSASPLPSSISGTVTIPDFKDGQYKVDWWNTTTGQVFDSQTVESTNNNIILGIHDVRGSDSVTSDVAVKIYPANLALTLILAADKTQISAGGIITYTVNFKNNAQDEMKNVVLSAPVPIGTTYVNNSATNNGIPGSGIVQWNLSTMAGGANFSASFQVKLQ